MIRWKLLNRLEWWLHGELMHQDRVEEFEKKKNKRKFILSRVIREPDAAGLAKCSVEMKRREARRRRKRPERRKKEDREETMTHRLGHRTLADGESSKLQQASWSRPQSISSSASAPFTRISNGKERARARKKVAARNESEEH